MKAFTIAAVALALLAVPAHAQLNSKRHAGDAQKKADPGAAKVDEKAYKAALERIPEPKEKYDPWARDQARRCRQEIQIGNPFRRLEPPHRPARPIAMPGR